MHQQPPNTPLFASTSAANASHVLSSRGLDRVRHQRSRNESTRSTSSVVAVGVVCGERRVGEEMLLAGVQEQLGIVGRCDERARSNSRSSSAKNSSASLPCTCTGTPAGHASPNSVKGRHAEMKSAPRSAGPRLRELLRGHHPERDAGVDDVGGKRPGGGDTALAERAEAGLARERHAFLERREGLPVEEVRRMHGVAALPKLLARASGLRRSAPGRGGTARFRSSWSLLDK